MLWNSMASAAGAALGPSYMSSPMYNLSSSRRQCLPAPFTRLFISAVNGPMPYEFPSRRVTSRYKVGVAHELQNLDTRHQFRSVACGDFSITSLRMSTGIVGQQSGGRRRKARSTCCTPICEPTGASTAAGSAALDMARCRRRILRALAAERRIFAAVALVY
jgi:hypothetical protein